MYDYGGGGGGGGFMYRIVEIFGGFNFGHFRISSEF